MRVNPISSEKANEQSASDPWPAGDYDFSIAEASEEVSAASGNEMIKLTLHVLNRDGNRRTVFDYLVNIDSGQWKIRHFAETVGLVKQYETGEMEPRDMVGRAGRCKLRIKPAQGNYSAQNAVGDYLPASTPYAAPVSRPASRQKAAAGGGDIDDDIPFAVCWE